MPEAMDGPGINMRTHTPLIAGIGLLFFALIATGAVLNLAPERLFIVEQRPVTAARSLSGRIPAGQVATALRFGRVESVSGRIRAGDTVDVYAFYSERAGAAATTRVLMREKLVYTASESPEAISLTLAMPPDEAVSLQDALLAGARPYAVLRSGRGLSQRAAPESFGDDSLSSWITQVAESR
jgi:hypothetical protein